MRNHSRTNEHNFSNACLDARDGKYASWLSLAGAQTSRCLDHFSARIFHFSSLLIGAVSSAMGNCAFTIAVGEGQRWVACVCGKKHRDGCAISVVCVCAQFSCDFFPKSFFSFELPS